MQETEDLIQKSKEVKFQEDSCAWGLENSQSRCKWIKCSLKEISRNEGTPLDGRKIEIVEDLEDLLKV